MKTGVSCVALGFGLFAATIIAVGQTISPSVVAQGPSSAPSSGVVAAPPAAPVSVPPSGVLATPPSAQRPVTPSGVLATVDRHRVSKTRPIKTVQNVHHQRSKPATMRRHVVHHLLTPRRDKSTPRTILAQNIASAPARPPRKVGPSSRRLGRPKNLRNDERPPGRSLARHAHPFPPRFHGYTATPAILFLQLARPRGRLGGQGRQWVANAAKLVGPSHGPGGGAGGRGGRGGGGGLGFGLGISAFAVI